MSYDLGEIEDDPIAAVREKSPAEEAPKKVQGAGDAQLTVEIYNQQL